MCLRIITSNEIVCPVEHVYHWHLVLALCSVIEKADLKTTLLDLRSFILHCWLKIK